MARPIQANAAATRQRILTAASLLFSANGLTKTTTRQIAEAGEVSLATVHHYFGGKTDLYNACITEMYSDLESLTQEFSAFAAGCKDTSVSALISIAIRRSYEFARAHRNLVRLMMRTVIDSGEIEARWRARYQSPLIDTGTALLASVVDKPSIQVRATFMALEYLVVRFTLNSTAETARVLGIELATEEECVRHVEDFLVSMALSQLGIEGA